MRAMHESRAVLIALVSLWSGTAAGAGPGLNPVPPRDAAILQVGLTAQQCANLLERAGRVPALTQSLDYDSCRKAGATGALQVSPGQEPAFRMPREFLDPLEKPGTEDGSGTNRALDLRAR